LFADPLRRRILLLLAGCELNLSALAQETGARLNLLHYHLKRLVEAGLVVCTREQARAGRPVRHYRALHSAFFVPDALLAERPGRAVARALDSALENARARGGGGTLFDIDERGRPRMRRLDETEGAAAFEIVRLLQLDPGDAAALAGELSALVRRYEGRAGSRRSEWIVRAALARRDS
jgi:DNA-binding transcriptional ArsR family regulator